MAASPAPSRTAVTRPFSTTASIPCGPVRVVRSNSGVKRMSSSSRRGRLMPSIRRRALFRGDDLGPEVDVDDGQPRPRALVGNGQAGPLAVRLAEDLAGREDDPRRFAPVGAFRPEVAAVRRRPGRRGGGRSSSSSPSRRPCRGPGRGPRRVLEGSATRTLIDPAVGADADGRNPRAGSRCARRPGATISERRVSAGLARGAAEAGRRRPGGMRPRAEVRTRAATAAKTVTGMPRRRRSRSAAGLGRMAPPRRAFPPLTP